MLKSSLYSENYSCSYLDATQISPHFRLFVPFLGPKMTQNAWKTIYFWYDLLKCMYFHVMYYQGQNLWFFACQIFFSENVNWSITIPDTESYPHSSNFNIELQSRDWSLTSKKPFLWQLFSLFNVDSFHTERNSKEP